MSESLIEAIRSHRGLGLTLDQLCKSWASGLGESELLDRLGSAANRAAAAAADAAEPALAALLAERQPRRARIEEAFLSGDRSACQRVRDRAQALEDAAASYESGAETRLLQAASQSREQQRKARQLVSGTSLAAGPTTSTLTVAFRMLWPAASAQPVQPASEGQRMRRVLGRLGQELIEGVAVPTFEAAILRQAAVLWRHAAERSHAWISETGDGLHLVLSAARQLLGRHETPSLSERRVLPGDVVLDGPDAARSRMPDDVLAAFFHHLRVIEGRGLSAGELMGSTAVVQEILERFLAELRAGANVPEHVSDGLLHSSARHLTAQIREWTREQHPLLDLDPGQLPGRTGYDGFALARVAAADGEQPLAKAFCHALNGHGYDDAAVVRTAMTPPGTVLRIGVMQAAVPWVFARHELVTLMEASATQDPLFAREVNAGKLIDAGSRDTARELPRLLPQTWFHELVRQRKRAGQTMKEIQDAFDPEGRRGLRQEIARVYLGGGALSPDQAAERQKAALKGRG